MSSNDFQRLDEDIVAEKDVALRYHVRRPASRPAARFARSIARGATCLFLRQH